MTETVSHILSEVEQLTKAEQAEVAYAVLRFLGQPLEQPDELRETELNRRVEEIQAGRATGRPAEEVFARLRERRT